MKQIFRIFKNDLKSVTRNLIIFVVIIGITILPALYAWFNIASNWDPYGSTENLQFAVCTEDVGYTYKTIQINAGDEIISGLKENRKMGWAFVSRDEATEGVKNGKYYAAVIIPKNFSESLLSIVSGNFKQAKLEYYVNEKKNAIAPKITDKGIQAIEESIGTEYVDTLGKTLASALGFVEEEFSANKKDLAKEVVSGLKTAKKDIKVFKSSVNVLISTLDSINDLIKSNKALAPTIKKSLNKAGVFSTDLKSILSATKGTASQVTASLDGIISSGEGYMSSVSGQIDEAFELIDSDSSKAAEKLSKVKVINQKLITVNNKIISILENMQSSLGADCKKAINKLKDANKKQEAIIKKIDSCCNTIRDTGALPKNVQSELKRMVSDAEKVLNSAESEYIKVKPKLNKLVNDAFSVLDDLTDFVNIMNAGQDQLVTVFDNGIDPVNNLKKALKNLNSFLTTVDKRIDKVIEKVDGLKGDGIIENLIMPIIKDPNALGKFISSPVSYNTNRIYPIKNYGSAMTPFYSSLAIWVGGIVLVAVINVELARRERERLGNPSTTKMFFGRYISFFALGQIQAIIIALGDLFFLKVQCSNKPLFVLTCMISSFIYTLLIYSLTMTFSVIGKALAVIILVIQIAGAGGTFPIELLPGPFKAISPFLPFKYGVNAMRETIAGVDVNNYLKNIGILAVYIIVALLIGLLLRKPCMKVIEFFNKKIEESDLVI